MKKQLFTLFMLISLVLTGCGITDISFSATATLPAAPTETPQPAFTPLPTDTPSPTPIPEVRIEQADVLLFNGDYAQALQEYETTLLQGTSSEERAAALTGIGYSHFLLTEYKQAIEAFSSVLDIYPTGFHVAKAYFYLGKALYETGEYAGAAEAWEEYLRVNPGVIDDTVKTMIGDAYMAAGQTDLAEDAYTEAVAAVTSGSTVDLEIKLARIAADSGRYEEALRLYSEISDQSDSDYIKGQMNFLSGQAYLQMGLPEQAYARFQDSMQKYPALYDTYSGMQALLLANQPVNDLQAGLVYYYMGDYGKAIEALQNEIQRNPLHTGAAHHFLAFSLIVMQDIPGALEHWQHVINEHAGDEYWEEAWDEKAYTLWAHQGRFDEAAQTYIQFVEQAPASPEAPQYLYWAARLYEMNLRLEQAALTWERLIVEFPAHELSFRGLFLAGVSFYRMSDYQRALTTFQRLILLEPDEETLAGAHLWVGKIRRQLGDEEAAQTTWRTAASVDPTGYYSERARELLEGKKPLQTDAGTYELVDNLEQERAFAENWLRVNFEIPPETELGTLSTLAENIHIRRGNAFYDLGLFAEAGAEYEKARVEIEQNPVSCYRLMNEMLAKGFYRHAILLSRQILDLAHFEDESTLVAPAYFNHIRFGVFFKDLILSLAEETEIDPLLLYGMVRQESFFEFYAGSSAGAVGLLQLIPGTAQDLVNYLKWPAGYQVSDLYRPMINLKLGAWYLRRQITHFGTDNLYVSLAAYNAGPSNADNWASLAGDDPDLFLEVVRFSETRDYIMLIAESMHIYEDLYAR